MPAVPEATPGAAATAAASKVTAIVLRAAWQFLIASFGLTLLYVNFHFLARYLGGSRKFCEFGSEWNPQSIATGKVNFGLKYVEIGGLVFLNFLVLIIILGALTLLGIIGTILANPIEAIGVFGGEIVSYFTS